MVKRKRAVLIATFLIVTAVAIVLLVTLFTGGDGNDFEGTLVRTAAMPMWYM